MTSVLSSHSKASWDCAGSPLMSIDDVRLRVNPVLIEESPSPFCSNCNCSLYYSVREGMFVRINAYSVVKTVLRTVEVMFLIDLCLRGDWTVVCMR